MELLLVLLVAAFGFGFFRLFRIPLNPWTGTSTLLLGAILVTGTTLAMNFNHPFTRDGRFTFVTMPIVPAVSGLVVEVPVRANTPLRQDEVLLRIDATPYQAIVNQKRAALAEAETNLAQLGSDTERFRTVLVEATSARDRAKQAYDRIVEVNESARRANRSGVTSELELENRRQTWLAAEAALRGAQAQMERAERAAGSEVDGVNAAVARLRAELELAEWNLDETVVRAPTAGQVTQLTLRPGIMAANLPQRPAMIFIPDEGRRFLAAFPPNALQRIRPGDEAEIAFDAIPGRVVSGRVREVLDPMATGEAQPGRLLAEIEILEDLSEYRLPGGAQGQVALYTDQWPELAVIRRVLLRVKAWLNFVFL